jgi:hypothetical protein
MLPWPSADGWMIDPCSFGDDQADVGLGPATVVSGYILTGHAARRETARHG